MAKSRGKTTRQANTPRPQGKMVTLGLPEIEIGAWRPADEAPPEQVHMLFSLKGLPPFIVRFKSPDSLDFLIEELARYRRYVWPGSEALDLANDTLEEEGDDA